jgi:hypothetical protein
MPKLLHPEASHNLPSFITAPGETDVLMVVMGIILGLAILMFGILFFRLHTLPRSGSNWQSASKTRPTICL